jgi:hypothetical protein
MSPDMLVRRAQRSNIANTDPLVSNVAGRTRAGFRPWNVESPWLALNRCIAREEWTAPTYSWISQQR